MTTNNIVSGGCTHVPSPGDRDRGRVSRQGIVPPVAAEELAETLQRLAEGPCGGSASDGHCENAPRWAALLLRGEQPRFGVFCEEHAARLGAEWVVLDEDGRERSIRPARTASPWWRRRRR
jgi:hypothetical protein